MMPAVSRDAGGLHEVPAVGYPAAKQPPESAGCWKSWPRARCLQDFGASSCTATDDASAPGHHPHAPAATAAAKAAAAAVAAVDAEIAAAQEEQRLQHAAAEHAGGAPLLYSRGAAGSNVRGSRSFGNSGVRRSSLEIIIPPGDVAMEGGTLPSPLTNSRSPGAALGLMWAPEGSRPSPCSAAGATTPSPDAASASAAAGTLPGSRRGSLEKRSSFSHSRRPSMEQRHVTFGPSTAFADDSVSNQPLVPTRIPSVRSSLELQQRERELPGQAAYGCGPHSAGAAVSGVAQSASSSSFFASAAVPQRRVTIDAEDDLSSMVSASAPSGTAASASTSSETPSPIIAWKAAAPPAAAAAAAAAALGVGSGSSRGLVHSASDTSRRHSFGLEPHPPAAAPAHRPLSHHLHGAEPAAATGLPPRNGERIVLNSDTSLGAGDPGQAAMIRCASPVGLASKPISAAASTHHHQHHAPGKAASCMASFGRTLVQRHVVEGVVAEEGEELAAASRSASPSPAPQAQRKGLSTLNLPSRFSMLTKSRSPSGSGNSLSAGADSDLVVQVSGGSCPVMQYGGAAAKPPAIFAVPRGGMAHHAASVAAAETDAAHLRSMLGRN